MSLQSEDYIGAVPVIISLSDTDCAVQEKPAPLTYLLPRSTALVAVRGDVQSHFTSSTILKADALPLVWLTYNSEPVPWQYPVGAIKDCVNAFESRHPTSSTSDCVSDGADARASASLALAALRPTVYASPLALEARLSCVAAERPPTVPCAGDESAAARRGGDDGIRDFLKQLMKGTFSVMYGSIRPLMDARSETMNDMLSFALCTATGEPFAQALRLYNERLSGLRRAAGNPLNIALMLHAPSARGPLHFSLFRVPVATGGGGPQPGEEPPAQAPQRSPLDAPLGEVLWRALRELGPAPWPGVGAAFAEGAGDAAAFTAEGIWAEDGRRVRFIVQGVEPPLCTPVRYLLDRFPTADGRLYVTMAVA